MTPALMKMWISIASMGILFVAMILIYFSRYKLKQKILKMVSAIIAYLLLFVSGVIILLVVFSGPTNT